MKTKQKKLRQLSIVSIILILLGSVFFVNEMSKNSKMETDLDEYMPKSHPAFVYSDQAEEWFNIKDGILIAIENKSGILNSQSLKKIKDMSLSLQAMDEFEDNDVMSLYTADNIVGTMDGMDVESFYEEIPQSKPQLDSLSHNIKSNDMVYGRLISSDETVALIVASLGDDSFNDDFYSKIMEFAKSYEDDNHVVYVAGRPIVEGTLGMLGPEDMKRMVPMVMFVIIVVLLLLLKSLRATVTTLLSVLFSTIWAFGFMALMGVPIYSVSTMMPVMLIAIGVAYGIYFHNQLNHFYLENQDGTKYEAVLSTIKSLWKPLSMAAFTTIIGFFSLLTSEVYPIKYFGIFTAFGILIAFILALTFLPATVLLLGSKRKKIKLADDVKTYTLMNRITDKLLQNKKVVFSTLILFMVISLWGISKVWINSSFLDKFEKNSDIVNTDAFVNSKFGGTSSLNLILESEEYDAFKDPQNLVLVDQLQEETEKLLRVGNSFSLSDYLKRMNKVMNADDEKYYAIPENSELVAQYLLLYEMSGDPENLTKVVNYDYNKLNITFQLKGDDSKTINEALDIIKGFEDDFQQKGIKMNYAGSGYKALVFSDLILDGQIKSIAMSMVLVLVLLVIMFKSLKAGLIGTIPIVITALISFGVMGLFNIPLSTTTALLSSIAIGIGVDYAIHFIQNYKVSVSKTNSRHEAIHETMKHTGRAILSNAVVVIAGFLVMLFSVFPPNRMLGLLVSLNMFTSFVGTLTVMMILVYNSKLFIHNDKIKK